MTVLEVADRLNISYDFCLRLIRQGKLDGTKRKNGEWNVTEDSVAHYLFDRAEREAKRRERWTERAPTSVEVVTIIGNPDAKGE